MRRSAISWHASSLALTIMLLSGVGTNWGKWKFICCARRIPSGHVCRVGDPMTEQVL